MEKQYRRIVGSGDLMVVNRRTGEKFCVEEIHPEPVSEDIESLLMKCWDASRDWWLEKSDKNFNDFMERNQKEISSFSALLATPKPAVLEEELREIIKDVWYAGKNFERGYGLMYEHYMASKFPEIKVAILNKEPQKEEWVSVEDRLPEPDEEEVLCVNIETGNYFPICKYSKEYGFYRAHPCNRSPLGFYNGVTHWRPLPAPPITSEQQ